MTTKEKAFEALQAGRPLEAEELAARAVRAAAERAGAQSAQYAAAEFDLGCILMDVGDPTRAAAAIRRAADVPATTDADRKAQLTYLMNLGEVLQRANRLDEARAVLDESLRGRAAYYGVDTEGYAFGQEALAELLFAQGEIDAAESMVERALVTLWNAGNARAIPVGALRAAVRASKYGDELPLLERFDELPPDLQRELVASCLERARRDPPEAALEVLQELRERIEDSRRDDGLVTNVTVAISNAARAAGQHDARIAALSWLHDRARMAGDPVQEINVSQALALARDEAGLVEAAEATYREALARCQCLPDSVRSQALRNFALFLAERQRAAEAEPLFVSSIEAAEAAHDAQELGLALGARGIFLQHARRLDEARWSLERALTLLPSSHPDALCAASHLDAIRSQRSCGCGDMSRALSRALEDLVRPDLPADLLASIEIGSIQAGDVQIRLARTPNSPESELLDRVVHQALARLRQQVR